MPTLKSLPLALLHETVTLLLSATTKASPKSPSPRGDDWQPLEELSDPLVQLLARTVINVYNRIVHKNLVYDKLVRGEKDSSQSYYRLVIAAKEGSTYIAKDNKYETVVYVSPYEDDPRISTFKKING